MAGDSVTWDDAPTSDSQGNSIAAPTWTLKYFLRGASKLDLTATANGSSWQTAITATASALLIPGVYFWQARAESGSSKVTLGSGRTVVKPSLESASENFDGRSQAKKDLEAVQAAIRALSSSGVSEYTIANRTVRKVDVPSLLKLESKLKSDVAREEKADKIKNGLGDPHNLYVRFK